MKKNNKIFGLIACSAVLAGAVSLGAANVNVAPAAAEETPVTFEVKQSAQVKYGEEGGIRFAATVSADYLATLGTTVKLVSSIDKAGNTDAGEAKTKEWIVKGEGSTYVDATTNTYYHAIDFSEPELETVLKQAAAVELQATMWLESDGEKVAGSEQTVTRSMRAVANAVYDQVDSDKQTELSGYFGTRYTAKNAFKELADDNAWVVDGGTVATAVYSGAAATGADLTVGKTATGSYALFDAEYNVYNVPSVTYVTKTLATQQEMRDTILGTANNQVIGTDEYYAVVANLGEGGLLHNNTFYCNPAYNVTFNGIFDGNGHTVTTTLRAGYNMFRNFGANAVIKNLGVYAVNTQQVFNDAGVQSWALLAKTAAAGSKVENCYIKVAAKRTTASTMENNPFVRLTLVGDGECSFEDVIFEVVNSRDTSLTQGVDLRDGIISATTTTNAQSRDFDSMLNNVYLVSSTLKEVMAYGSLTSVGSGSDSDLGESYYFSEAVRYYAANDSDLMDEDRYGANGEDDTVTIPVDKNGREVEFITEYGDDYIGKQVQCTSTYRYDTGADMATAGKTQVGNWAVAADGTISWVNSGN